ncbi:hypothetical protein HAX54_011087 [Datura stramonium]|uniref:Uncharacterized protein n=1 Tax=Datura stramonium TaxID=4076 RepID=A0ABS8X0X7_DATST|nr:hypothetical protein [Datura stramonium]
MFEKFSRLRRNIPPVLLVLLWPHEAQSMLGEVLQWMAQPLRTFEFEVSPNFLLSMSFEEDSAGEDPIGTPPLCVFVCCCDCEAEGLPFVDPLFYKLFISMAEDPTQSELEDDKVSCFGVVFCFFDRESGVAHSSSESIS